MSRLTAGLAWRFFVFCREVLSEMLTVSPPERNQTSDSCGRPSGPIVPRVANSPSSRSRSDEGIAGMVLLLSGRGYRASVPLGGAIGARSVDRRGAKAP